MKRISLFITLLVLSNGLVFSQDVIIFKNGDEVKAKVKEVSTDVVKYNKWDNREGPLYSTGKSDIFMIKYQNGTKDVFNDYQKNVKPDNSATNSQSNVDSVFQAFKSFYINSFTSKNIHTHMYLNKVTKVLDIDDNQIPMDKVSLTYDTYFNDGSYYDRALFICLNNEACIAVYPENGDKRNINGWGRCFINKEQCYQWINLYSQLVKALGVEVPGVSQNIQNVDVVQNNPPPQNSPENDCNLTYDDWFRGLALCFNDRYSRNTDQLAQGLIRKCPEHNGTLCSYIVTAGMGSIMIDIIQQLSNSNKSAASDFLNKTGPFTNWYMSQLKYALKQDQYDYYYKMVFN